MVFHLLLGQVDQQRVHLLLQLGLLREDAPLLEEGLGAEGAEFWMVGDVEEALAALGRPSLLVMRQREQDSELADLLGAAPTSRPR